MFLQRIDAETVEKLQTAVMELRIEMKKMNEFNDQFPFDLMDDQLNVKRKRGLSIVQRFKKSKSKNKDNKELLKTLHGEKLLSLNLDFIKKLSEILL